MFKSFVTILIKLALNFNFKLSQVEITAVVFHLSGGAEPNETFQRLDEPLCINLSYSFI